MTKDVTPDENYQGVFDGHLKPGNRPAVLLVDMVMAYLDPDSSLYCETAQAAVDAAAELAAAARAAGAPVIFTGVEYTADGANGGLFYRKVPALKTFIAGSPGGAFPDDLSPRPEDWQVVKQMPSAFFDTGLAPKLKAAGIDTLLICGFSTSGCVRASTLDALQYGFAPFVVRDACADRHASPHEANLFDMQAKYAEVIDLASALEILTVR